MDKEQKDKDPWTNGQWTQWTKDRNGQWTQWTEDTRKWKYGPMNNGQEETKNRGCQSQYPKPKPKTKTKNQKNNQNKNQRGQCRPRKSTQESPPSFPQKQQSFLCNIKDIISIHNTNKNI